jgi:hypothetical protein
MNRKKLSTIFLILGMFFNPFGFDAIQLLLIKLTGSYGKANLVLYCLAASCFGLYFLFSGNNPVTEIRDIVKSIWLDKIAHFKNKIKSKNTFETKVEELKITKNLD